MRKIILSLLLTLSQLAHASSPAVHAPDTIAVQLTAEQQAALNTLIKTENQPVVEAVKIASAVGWGKEAAAAAEGFAQALGTAARTLNVETNSFASTPVGKLAIAFILVKVFGPALMHLIVSCIGFFVILTVLKQAIRIFMSGPETTTLKPARLWGLIPERTVTTRSQLQYRELEDGSQFLVIVTLIVGVISAITFSCNVGGI